MHLKVARRQRSCLIRLFCGLIALVVVILIIYRMFPLTSENSTQIQREEDHTLKTTIIQRREEDHTSIPKGRDPCKAWDDVKEGMRPTEWWQYFCELESDWLTKDYNCTDRRMMGNRGVCFDAGLISHESCIVYSFGIDFDFTFDDAMAEFGCTVYSFDPSMNITDHQHAERVHFKSLGLSGHDNDSFVPRIDVYVRKRTTWRVRRLTTIMKELKHDPGTLTILKMDIESNEFDVLKDLLKSDILPTIPQVLVEWHLFRGHPNRSRYADIYADYFKFKSLGFRKFWNPSRLWPHTIDVMTSQAEISYLNRNYLL